MCLCVFVYTFDRPDSFPLCKRTFLSSLCERTLCLCTIVGHVPRCNITNILERCYGINAFHATQLNIRMCHILAIWVLTLLGGACLLWAFVEALYCTLIILVLGSGAVFYSYADVFASEDNYATSRYWVGVNPNAVIVLVPLQLQAGMGFIMFVSSLLVKAFKTSNRIAAKGIFSYRDGGACVVVFFCFFSASIAWPFAARAYLDSKDTDPSHKGDECLMWTTVSTWLWLR